MQLHLRVEFSKEYAINTDTLKGSAKSEREVESNTLAWLCKFGIYSAKYLSDEYPENPPIDPINPYSGQVFKDNELSRREYWFWCQKLFNIIFDEHSPKINFQEYFFNTVLSEVCGNHRNNVSTNAKSKSIKERVKMFESIFFQKFSIVIVAAGNDVKDYNIDLQKLFKVKYYKPTRLIGNNWINVYKTNLPKPKLLIQVKQLNMITNDLQNEIANECKNFLAENQIAITNK